ncbi:MAG: ADP-ribosylglycohydrolase family protein [Acidimicrobiia bacterium]
MTPDTDSAQPPGDPRPSSALQSLLVDEGAGAPLAAAAGDVAAGHLGYSARTQAATVVAYHLMAHDGIDTEVLQRDLLELGRATSGVYTRGSVQFVDWLASAEAGAPAASGVPTSEPATRVVPLGVWFRHDAATLVHSAVELARMESVDASTVLVSAAAAGAVAASTLVMSGWDLVLAARETAERALEVMEAERYRFAGFERATQLPRAIGSLRALVGKPYGEVASAMSDIHEGLRPAVASIVVSADTRRDPVLTIEDAAVNGGPDAGVLAGAILGARVGLRRWPWRVPNETWFAEIGRRLVTHERELRDLPIPYAVEERMKNAGRGDRGFEVG